MVGFLDFSTVYKEYSKLIALSEYDWYLKMVK